ncbi:MAG: hypothetical protein U1A27_07260 [Phycisphaerae bacterium]
MAKSGGGDSGGGGMMKLIIAGGILLVAGGIFFYTRSGTPEQQYTEQLRKAGVAEKPKPVESDEGGGLENAPKGDSEAKSAEGAVEPAPAAQPEEEVPVAKRKPKRTAAFEKPS